MFLPCGQKAGLIAFIQRERLLVRHMSGRLTRKEPQKWSRYGVYVSSDTIRRSDHRRGETPSPRIEFTHSRIVQSIHENVIPACDFQVKFSFPISVHSSKRSFVRSV